MVRLLLKSTHTQSRSSFIHFTDLLKSTHTQSRSYYTHFTDLLKATHAQSGSSYIHFTEQITGDRRNPFTSVESPTSEIYNKEDWTQACHLPKHVIILLCLFYCVMLLLCKSGSVVLLQNRTSD